MVVSSWSLLGIALMFTGSPDNPSNNCWWKIDSFIVVVIAADSDESLGLSMIVPTDVLIKRYNLGEIINSTPGVLNASNQDFSV
jgi:hypothetical protein